MQKYGCIFSRLLARRRLYSRAAPVESACTDVVSTDCSSMVFTMEEEDVMQGSCKQYRDRSDVVGASLSSSSPSFSAVAADDPQLTSLLV